jgi:probable F420-dependent oxidoreductase
MKIGFGAPVSGSWATPENLAHVARRAEELGYHALWTYQRLLSPVDAGWGEVYRSVQDPITPLAYIAALTDRIRLSIAVVNLPFVSPVVLAKQLATVDVLSGGRLDAGFGNGWSDEEFTATGASKRGQGARADEFIEVLKRLWTDEIVAYEGTHYRIPPMRMDPKPVQRPYPPILLGAGSPPALLRAGRLCDGWVSSSRADPRALGESVATVKAGAEQAGRDPAGLRFVCRAAVRVRPGAGGAGGARPGPGGSPRPMLVGTPDQIRADFAEIAAQGITELFVDLNFDPEIGSPDADPAESRRRADEALTAFAPETLP